MPRRESSKEPWNCCSQSTEQEPSQPRGSLMLGNRSGDADAAHEDSRSAAVIAGVLGP